MKLLVTGGAGFIGSNFIRYILGRYPEYKIINLDKLTYCGNLENLRDVQNNTNYKFIKGDICDSKIVQVIIKDCDVIINFAASTHVDRSILNSTDFVKTNFYGVFILLEAVRKSKISRFIQIST
ncbi:MAG: NAD-dependent epimerase/dehydratase family protein, partial [Candidatus Omnitrophica bacterium]|nr:NAD-dependent epimerase/dehydratase family protein [Candidatus Omnitrophota bacterium]